MTFLQGPGGGMAPSAPPGSATVHGGQSGYGPFDLSSCSTTEFLQNSQKRVLFLRGVQCTFSLNLSIRKYISLLPIQLICV